MNRHVYSTRLEKEQKPQAAIDTQTYYQTPSTSSYHQPTSSYHHQSKAKIGNGMIPADETEQLASVVHADQMNDFIDSYFGDSSSAHDDHYHIESTKKSADEDLEVLLKETDDMHDIQEQIHLEQAEMADKYREERSRQRRAAAARSRYQRMSENERRVYNHRRRLKQLGLDPDVSKSEGQGKDQVVKMANAKKAEAARLRYHRMTPEQKRDYNMRRTEAFRRRRQEEEMLLSTPAGRISAEALAKAQQIMVRNARKAESARLRYQKMTPEERRQYNMKRAAAKKTRKLKTCDDVLDEGDEDLDDEELDDEEVLQFESGSDTSIVEPTGHEVQHEDIPMYFQNGHLLDDGLEPEDHMLHVINEVAHPSELDIFTRMENDVIRRTRIANATIQKHNSSSSNAIVGGIQYDLTPPLVSYPEPIEEPRAEKTHVIDEKMLHEMVRTGVDANGLPVEIRTVDGKPIKSIEDLIAISHGQTVLITQQHVEPKPAPFGADPNLMLSSPTEYQCDESVAQFQGSSGDEYDCESSETMNPDDLKVKMTRARRAERARARYHRMTVDQRREQNAKRAMMLRKSRARDDQLCHLADTVPPEQIDEETSKAIRDAQQRRARRAEQARTKYHRMNSEQRRKYNATRDAQRRQRKSEQRTDVFSVLVSEKQEDQPSTSSGMTSSQPECEYYSYDAYSTSQ